MTKQEERWNAATHAAGIVLCAAASALFGACAVARADWWALLGVGLYAFGSLASYVSSTVYHALPVGAVKEGWRKADHSAIYCHIAGSYSPICLTALRGAGLWGWGLLVFVWACAVAGTASSVRRLKKHSNLETACFVAMGLSITAAFPVLWHAVGTAAVAWIVGEGVAYITGAAFYTAHKRPYMHTVFHFFVLAGSACHIVALYLIL